MFEGLFQPMHLLVIFFIAMLVFGPKKISDLGKGLGQGIREFKNAINEKDAPPPAALASRNEPQSNSTKSPEN
jgi:sec-independent protein translocase protein TatA